MRTGLEGLIVAAICIHSINSVEFCIFMTSNIKIKPDNVGSDNVGVSCH